MQLSTFQTLLRERNPQASAWHDTAKAGRICVSFRPGSKVYTYRSTVIDLAKRLELVPEVDVWEESERIVRELASAGVSTGPAHCKDTVRVMMYEQGYNAGPGAIVSKFTHVHEYEYDVHEYTYKE